MARFDINGTLAGHPAAQALTPHQIGVWTLCGMWSSANRTAGKVPRNVAHGYGASDSDIAEMIRCGMWAQEGDDVAYAMPGLCRFIAGDWRPKVPRRIRKEVIARTSGACVQCGSTEEPQIDHIKPWSKGGTHALDNLQLLCGPCNRAKGARW